MMQLSMQEPSTGPVVSTLSRGIADVLGPELVGIYLIGSAVSGGFDPGVSDVDLIAVTESEAGALALPALEAVTSGFVRTRPEWTERVEVVYVGRSTLQSFRTGGTLAVVSPGEPFHVRDDATDWAQTWYQLRETAVTLSGPPPCTLVPPIDWPEFTRALARTARAIRAYDRRDATPGARAYAVLTLCRTLVTIRTDRLPSKQQAAAWVSDRMPEWEWLIQAALACRSAGGREGFDDPETRAAVERFLELLVTELPAG
jgi:hypothetical protein